MVMPQVGEQVGMAMEDFIRLYDQEGPFELIDGEWRRLMPNVAGHGAILKLLYDLLLAYEKTASIFVQRELPYVLSYSSNWVTGSRVPDLMIYRADRINTYMQEVPVEFLESPIPPHMTLCQKYMQSQRTVFRFLFL